VAASARCLVARRSGRVVNVSSNAAFFRLDDDDDPSLNSAYLASKAALIRFTEALAAEARPAVVAIFAISPGMVKTDLTAAVFAHIWDDPDVWTLPERTAELIEFLDSGALDGLSGRYIHARNDDWRAMAVRVPDILERDLHALRVATD
jgi:3-oxoacyl-[acyl-carrier protein] reductase